MSICWAGKALNRIRRWATEVNMGIMRRTFGRGWLYAIHLAWRSGGVTADAPTIQPDVLWAERFEGW